MKTRISTITFDSKEKPVRAVIRTIHGTVRVHWMEVCGGRGWFTSGSGEARKAAVSSIERIGRMAERL